MLYVAPHTMFFIGDQLRAVERLTGGVDVLLPSPYLSGVAARLPLFSHRFASLKRARESKPGTTGRLIRARYFDVPGRFGWAATGALASKSAVRAISGGGAEFALVHSHFIGLNALIGGSIKKKYGIPLVVTAYGGDAYSLPFRDPSRRRLAVSVIEAADRLIAVSEPIAESLASLGAQRGKISVIPTGYDAAVFRPVAKAQARSRLGLPESKLILLTVANLVPQKGHSYLLGAFKEISKARPDAMLAIVGGGELASTLRREAGGLGVNGAVLFAGPRPHEEIPAWMSACDVFVLPSLSEGTPTVLPEAMACGKPIVSTNVGGIPGVVKDGEVGYLVRPKDTAALADASLRALGRSWDADAIMASALPYSWAILAGRIAELYSEVS